MTIYTEEELDLWVARAEQHSALTQPRLKRIAQWSAYSAMCRGKENAARAAGDIPEAEKWKDGADAWDDVIAKTRDSAVKKAKIRHSQQTPGA